MAWDRVFVDLDKVKPMETARGITYHPIWRAVPVLEPLYTRYEKGFNAAPAFIFLHDNMWIPLLAVGLYLAFCIYGPIFMRDRKPSKLRRALAFWNLSLSTLSFVGAARVLTHLAYLLSPWGGYSFRDTVCEPPERSYGDNATGLWCIVFTVSKLLELGDTVFVVLRKKPLIFLHWYHHATVLLCSWFGHVTFTPALYFMGINYSIHAVMYLYFGLMALGRVPKWFNPVWITVSQISQMFVGLYVTLASWFYKHHTPDGCAVESRMLVAILAMYSSYLVLFLNFFLHRFVLPRLASMGRVAKSYTRNPIMRDPETEVVPAVDTKKSQ